MLSYFGYICITLHGKIITHYILQKYIMHLNISCTQYFTINCLFNNNCWLKKINFSNAKFINKVFFDHFLKYRYVHV